MAVSLEGNVIQFTATGDTHDNAAKLKICGIKLVGNAVDASTVVIRDVDASGPILYSGKSAVSADLYEQIKILVDRKIHVTLTGTGTVLYVYLE